MFRRRQGLYDTRSCQKTSVTRGIGVYVGTQKERSLESGSVQSRGGGTGWRITSGGDGDGSGGCREL